VCAWKDQKILSGERPVVTHFRGWLEVIFCVHPLYTRRPTKWTSIGTSSSKALSRKDYNFRCTLD
jgi:hypothetical protein